MKKPIKIMIGLLFLISILGIFTTNVKSQDIITSLRYYPDYTLTGAYLINEPTEYNNYRFEFYKDYYNIGNPQSVYLTNTKVINSKYGFSQCYYEFNGNYNEFPVVSEKIGTSTKIIASTGTVDYEAYMYVEGSITSIKIGYSAYLDTGTGFVQIVGTGSVPFNLIEFNFAENEIELDSIFSIETLFQYRMEVDKDIMADLVLLINGIVVETLVYEIYDNSYDFTYIYASNVQIFHYTGYPLTIDGMRVFYLDTTDKINDFIAIPIYKENIFTLPEPEIYEGEYWYYISYQLTEAELEVIEFSEIIEFQGTNTLQNFTYDFQHTEGLLYNTKFYYTSMVVNPTDMGDWSIVWNWLRDGIAWICNALLVALQFLLYLLVAGISILFGWLFIAIIIPFVWNVLFFWIIYGAVYLIFYVWIGLMVLLDFIIDLILPLLSWIIVEALPIIIAGLIFIISWIFALLFYLISLGTGDLIQLQVIIQQFLNVIADFFISSMAFIVNYMPEILTYVLFYFILIGFCFLKITYTNARGFVNRSNQLQASLSAYMTPINLGYTLLDNIKNLIVMWW